jgi:anti-sigma factor RsiW
MTAHDRRRIEDLLDGLLGPAEAAAVRRRIAEDPEWAREERTARAVHALLEAPLDLAVPPELAPAVLKVVTVDRVRRRILIRLPARVENALVLAATAALGALVAAAPRLIGPQETGGWLGRLAATAASSLTGSIDTLVRVAAKAAHLDWLGRLVSTLSEAARTVVSSSAEPILVLGVISFVLAAGVALVLVRTERGGVHHVHGAV